MMLSDVRDYIDSLKLADYVFQSKMDSKKEKAIGVYNSKHKHAYKTAIGGPELESYGMKYATLLVHWNKSPRETEKASMAIFEAVKSASEVTINNETIKFIQPLYDIQDVSTDDNGVYEMVIEMAVIYAKKGKGE